MLQQPMLEQLEDRHAGLRVLAMLLFGAAGALLLTWFMHQLITASEHNLDESSRAHMVDFVRLQRKESSQQQQRKPPRPTQADAPPTPSAPASAAEATLSVSASVAPEAFAADVSIDGLGISGSDGEYLPTVKVAPMYPRSAVLRGIEGSCIVQYTVTTNGSTRDVKVLEDHCSDSAFVRPSIEAARKFKYKPRVIGGEAIEVHGVTNRFIYELEN